MVIEQDRLGTTTLLLGVMCDGGEIEPEHPDTRQVVLADEFSDLDRHPEFFHDLPPQRLAIGLPGFDLAARRFPVTRGGRRLRAPREQHAAIADDRRCHHDHLLMTLRIVLRGLDHDRGVCHCRVMSRLLNPDEVEHQLRLLPGWSASHDSIRCDVTFPDFPSAIEAVRQVAIEAEEMNHHPDMDIRWRTVTFTLSTHSAGGITQLDIELAHRIRLINEESHGHAS